MRTAPAKGRSIMAVPEIASQNFSHALALQLLDSYNTGFLQLSKPTGKKQNHFHTETFQYLIKPHATYLTVITIHNKDVPKGVGGRGRRIRDKNKFQGKH